MKKEDDVQARGVPAAAVKHGVISIKLVEDDAKCLREDVTLSHLC